MALAVGATVAGAAVPLSAGPVAGAASPRTSGRVTVLESAIVLADGELRFAPPGPGARPRQRAASVLATAEAAAGRAARSVRPRVYFGLFSATSPARKGPDGSAVPVFERRPVWIIRYPAVRTKRASGVVQRRVPPSTRRPTTTVDPFAVVDIVVVIDDRDGRQILRSEYAAERVVGLDVPVPTTVGRSGPGPSSVVAPTAAPASTVPDLELRPTSTAVSS